MHHNKILFAASCIFFALLQFFLEPLDRLGLSQDDKYLVLLESSVAGRKDHCSLGTALPEQDDLNLILLPHIELAEGLSDESLRNDDFDQLEVLPD